MPPYRSICRVVPPPTREFFADSPGTSPPNATVGVMPGQRKNMDRWLGDGGMEVIGLVGASFSSYGVDGEDLGWVAGTWTPTALACNPHGTAQAGIHSLIL